MTKFDTSSAEPVLFLTGPGLNGVPDTDLSANQLARIAWTRLDPDKRPNLPGDLDEKAIGALADELVKTGSYSKKEPADPAKPEA